MKETILRRLAALESHTRPHPIPSEDEFWILWGELGELDKSLLVLSVENRSNEQDLTYQRFLCGIAPFLFSAGLADPNAETLRELAHQMDMGYDIES